MIQLGPTSLALRGQMPSLGCQACEQLVPCGGVYEGWDCEDNCCNEPENCTTGCFRSRRLATVVRDAGGLSRSGPWNIRQSSRILPAYIPHIHNGYGRSRNLSIPYAALTT